MKLMVISDIHGSIADLNNALDIFNKKNYDRLIIVGDILYHGPRNPIPDKYNPKEVAEKLNNMKNKIIAIRGNCDSEVDQMVLDFPVLADYNVLIYNDKTIFITHGHLEKYKEMLCNYDIVLTGHTHIYKIERNCNTIYCNSGSITLPKNNLPKTYGSFESNKFIIRDFEDNILKDIDLK